MKRTASNNSVNSQDIKRQAIENPREEIRLRNRQLPRSSSSDSLSTIDSFSNLKVHTSNVARIPRSNSSDSLSTIDNLDNLEIHTSNITRLQLPSVTPIIDVTGIMDLATDFRRDDFAAPDNKREPVYNPDTDVLSGRGGPCNNNKVNKNYRTYGEYYRDIYSNITKKKKKTFFSEGLIVCLINNYGYRFVNKQEMSDAVTFLTQEEARVKIAQFIRDNNNPSKAS